MRRATVRAWSEPNARECIEELLQRFDAYQLRTAFKDLYLTRLHVARWRPFSCYGRSFARIHTKPTFAKELSSHNFIILRRF